MMRRLPVHFAINNASVNQKFKLQFLCEAMFCFDKNQLQNQDLTSVAIKLAPNAPELYNLMAL